MGGWLRKEGAKATADEVYCIEEVLGLWSRAPFLVRDPDVL
jgi:hypothetical protein